MGRSTQEKALENRAKIVDNANLLFRQHGVEHVSVSDVMGTCGMTVGGFYKHFESKEALVAEVCDLAFEQALTKWDKVYKNADASAKGRNLELVRGYINNRNPERRCPILAFAPQATASTEVTAPTQAYKAGIHELFDKFMEGAPQEDDALPTLPSRDAMVLFAAMIGARVLNQAVGNADWIKDIEDAVIATAALPSQINRHT